MKFAPASFSAKKILLALVLFGMAGCSSMPHVFGENEVPQGAINAPRLVAQPSPEALNAPGWPRLGDVPSKPNDFSSPHDYNQSMTELETERGVSSIDRAESGIAPAVSAKSSSSPTPGF